MIYNTIHHQIRNNAGLSLIDWCLLESIYLLSSGPKATYSGWCNASKASFSYLASKRTIVNRLNHLEKTGWIQFKDESRYLKRTTKKYYEEVYSFVLGVKKLHGGGENIAPLVVKELHGGGEKVAPNKNINNNTIDNNIDSVLNDTQKKLKEAEFEIAELKKQIEKKERKSSAKKKEVKAGQHQFPNNKGQKAYNPKDKRPNKQLPFNVISAKETLEALFPTVGAIEERYNSIFRNYQASEEIFEHCLVTFIETGITNYYSGIRDIVILEKTFLEWIKKEVIFRRRKSKRHEKPTTNNQSKSMYENYEDMLRKDGNETEDGAIDVEWTEA